MSTAQIEFRQSNNQLRNADKVWHLQRAGLTDGLSIRDLHILTTLLTDRIYRKEDVIFHQGDPADSLYILNRGTVRLMVGTSTGREKIISVLATGDIFGEDVLGPAKGRQCQAVAHEESWVSSLNRETLLALLRDKPALALNFVGLLNKKLTDARDEIEALSFHDTEHRIAKMLLKLSDQHGKSLVSPKPLTKLKIPVSHEHLAQLIGANRPHVSAIMSEFKKKGLIGYQKRKLLIDVKQVSKIVTEGHEAA